jgi:Protein of unknown function (DUF3618)/Putative Actinobacterial Holin-X, holin superfamily III
LAGGMIAYGGLLASSVLMLIAIGLPPWAAALLGGVLVAGIGYLLIRSGLAALKPQDLAPRKTIETLKQDAQWAQGSGEVGATTDEIRSQIEHTRGEMSDTIDAIQSRLSPKRVLADAKDSVTEATVARVKRLTTASRGEVWQRMQNNPLPIALLATAAAGLLVRSWTNRRRQRPNRRISTTSRKRPSAGRLLVAAEQALRAGDLESTARYI